MKPEELKVPQWVIESGSEYIFQAGAEAERARLSKMDKDMLLPPEEITTAISKKVLSDNSFDVTSVDDMLKLLLPTQLSKAVSILTAKHEKEVQEKMERIINWINENTTTLGSQKVFNYAGDEIECTNYAVFYLPDWKEKLKEWQEALK